MVKDKTPLNHGSCFLTNNQHPWDGQIANAVTNIEDHLDGRLGSKDEEEGLVSQLLHHHVSLTEEEVQDAYIRRIGLCRYRIIPDGNCLYRAIAQALFGTQEMHNHVRQISIEHLSQNVAEFLPFFDTPDGVDLLDFALEEVERLKKDHTWGGFESLMAMSDLYNIEFHVVLGGHAKNRFVTIHKYCFNRNEGDLQVEEMPKKVFLIWMNHGHYDLATDTPQVAHETEAWIQEMQAIQDSFVTTGIEEKKKKKRKKKEIEFNEDPQKQDQTTWPHLPKVDFVPHPDNIEVPHCSSQQPKCQSVLAQALSSHPLDEQEISAAKSILTHRFELEPECADAEVITMSDSSSSMESVGVDEAP